MNELNLAYQASGKWYLLIFIKILYYSIIFQAKIWKLRSTITKSGLEYQQIEGEKTKGLLLKLATFLLQRNFPTHVHLIV
jgi:hypothetical protein